VLAKLTENFLLENLTKKSKFTNFDATTNYCWSIGVARGREQKAMPPKFLKNIDILCFQRRFSKQNNVIHQPKNLGGTKCSQPKNLGGSKMFDFRRITLYCLEKCLSKNKMTVFKKFGGPWLIGPPLATPINQWRAEV